MQVQATRDFSQSGILPMQPTLLMCGRSWRHTGTPSGCPPTDTDLEEIAVDVASEFTNPLPSDFGLVFQAWQDVMSVVHEDRLSNEPHEAGDPGTPTGTDWLCNLRWWVRASQLRCMYQGGLWRADQEGGRFDCDDFTLAMRNWLQRRMGDTVARPLLVRWQCEGGVREGHWMPVIERPDGYYLIDPYSGSVVGPYPQTPAGRRQMAERTLRFLGVNCEFRLISGYTKLLETNNRGQLAGWRESRAPFWRDPEALSRFCDHLRVCCGQLPPGNSGECPECPDLLQSCMPPPVGAGDAQLQANPCDIREYFPADVVVPLPSGCASPVPPTTP